jgi:hypothetical protein
MAKKIDFDFKQFMLQKGERVGLAVAVAIAALLFILGVMTGLGKSSPLPEIEKNTQKLSIAINGNDKPKEEEPPKPPRFEKGINPNEMAIGEWSIPSNMEDKGKRNPQILGLLPNPQVDVLKVPVLAVDYEKGRSVRNLQAAAGEAPLHPAEVLRPTRMVIVSAAFPYKKQLEAFQWGLRLKKLEELKEAPQFLGFLVYRRAQRPDGTIEKTKNDSEWELLELDGDKSSIRDLIAAAPAVEPLDAREKTFAFPGLVMPLPILADVASYPPVRLKDLEPGQGKKMDMAHAPAEGNKVFVKKWDDLPAEVKDRLSGKTVDVFNPEPYKPLAEKGAIVEKAREPQNLNLKLERCLVRFVDNTVQPGYTYDYSIVIRVANPNYGKKREVAAEGMAQVKELLSGHNYITRVHVPYDVQFYAVDERAMAESPSAFDKGHMLGADIRSGQQYGKYGDMVAVQIHRWVDNVPGQAGRGGFNLGTWLIAERLLVRRGEFISQRVRVDVPEWVQTAEQFQLPEKKGKAPKGQGLEVDFTVKTESQQLPVLLVDFNGGRQTVTVGKGAIMDESAADLLILTPDGKLTVRSGVADAETDNVRKERYDAWKMWIKKLNGTHKDKMKKEPSKEGFGGGDRRG